MRIPETLRTSVWWLALAAAVVTVLLVTLPWTHNHPPVPLLTALSWGCFLAVSGLLVVLALRRRQLLRDRPSISIAVLSVCLFFAASLSDGGRRQRGSFDLAVLSVCLFFAASLWGPPWIPATDTLSFGIYFLVAGAFHLLAFLVVALLLSPLAFRSSARYFSLIERIGLFSGLLLLTGAILNAAWMLLVYKRLYYSQDTVVDCFAFIPFGQWVLDTEWAGKTGALLAGTELWHLQALWLLFATLAWGSAALGYRRIARVLAV